MHSTPAVWALFALAATAQTSNWSSEGPYLPGPFSDTPAAQQILETAGQHPNATSSVTFNRTDDNMLSMWSWRVNVTDIPFPNDVHDFGITPANYSDGLHITNTQWQLDWPDDSESLQAYLGDHNMSIRFTFINVNVPANVTASYNAQDAGNCSAIIGDQCTKALTDSASSASDAFADSTDGCPTVIGGDTLSLDSNFTGVVLQPSSSLYFWTSKTYLASNVTVFDEAASALQVLVMDFQAILPADSARGGSSGASVVCQIVEAKKSAAVGWGPITSSAVWGIALLSTAAVMW